MTAVSALHLEARNQAGSRWHGHVHTVVVLDDGFEYQGQRYPSLTRIARRITGSHWSGPLFFGIKRQPSLRSLHAANE